MDNKDIQIKVQAYEITLLHDELEKAQKENERLENELYKISTKSTQLSHWV